VSVSRKISPRNCYETVQWALGTSHVFINPPNLRIAKWFTQSSKNRFRQFATRLLWVCVILVSSQVTYLRNDVGFIFLQKYQNYDYFLEYYQQLTTKFSLNLNLYRPSKSLNGQQFLSPNEIPYDLLYKMNKFQTIGIYLRHLSD